MQKLSAVKKVRLIMLRYMLQALGILTLIKAKARNMRNPLWISIVSLTTVIKGLPTDPQQLLFVSVNLEYILFS